MIPLAVLVCVFVGLVAAVIIAIIILIIRRAARSGANVTPGVPRPPVNAATQVGPDGFWLSSFDPGSVIYCQYWAGGMKKEAQIVFQPGNDGRQFVYTGMQPNNVEIVRVVAQSGGVVTGADYYDDTPDIVPPIIGGIVGQAVADALQPKPPAPPPPPQFPSAY
jgi:hypothetical protein